MPKTPDIVRAHRYPALRLLRGTTPGRTLSPGVEITLVAPRRADEVRYESRGGVHEHQLRWDFESRCFSQVLLTSLTLLDKVVLSF